MPSPAPSNTLTVSARDSLGNTLDSFSITKTPVASDAAPTWVHSEMLVWPNPSQGVATLELGARADDLLDAGGALEVRIFGVDGRLVRRRQARTPRLQWDGRDRQGQPAPNGVYLVRTYSHDTPLTPGTKIIRSR